VTSDHNSISRDLERTENLKTKRLPGIESKTPYENIMYLVTNIKRYDIPNNKVVY
jgi:hypothetical protein